MALVSPQVLSTIKNELRPVHLLPSLTTGVVIGITDTTLSLAFASLIFAGDLSGSIPRAIGLMLLSQLVVSVVVALLTSLPGTLAGLQDISAAVLAVSAATIAAASPAGGADAAYWTVAAVLALSAFSTGAFLWLLGHFKLGNLVRFIPYSVIGGFLGGTGLLLVRGGISVLTNTSLDLDNLTRLLDGDMLAKWLPGLGVAVLLLVLLPRSSSPLLIPGIVVGTVAVFYAALLVSGTSVAQASGHGWMMIGQSERGTWQPWSLAGLEKVDWGLVAGQAGTLGVIAALSAVSLLLNATGLELLFQQDFDLNRELKAAGAANVLAGLAGGGIGFHALSSSLLSDKLGTRGYRLPGVLVGLFGALALFVGGGVLAYVPRLLLGGLIVFLGLALLVEWVYEAWFKFPRVEYLMVICILLIMNGIGFLEGVAIGLVLAVIVFTINYGKTPVVKQALSGTTYRSRVVRSNLHQGLLRSKGDWVQIFKLQGYLFFGTANRLLEEFRARLADAEHPAPHYVLFDFRAVKGLDSSAELSFIRIKQIAQTHRIELLFTGLSPDLYRQLSREVLRGDGCRVFLDLDRGMEWCEDQILDVFAGVGLVGRSKTVSQQLKESLGAPERYAQLASYLDRQDIEAGHVLIRQGETAPGLYFIEQGRVTVQLEAEQGEVTRLRCMQAGTIVGETGLYLNRRATASVVAEQSCTVYCLSAEALRALEAEHPDLASAFHRFMIGLLVARLGHTTEVLQALID